MSKAILITYPESHALKEARSLAEAAGYDVVKTITQKYLTKSKYGIGAGKADEVKEYVASLKPDVIVFDEVLKSIQLYNLGKRLGVEVIDRERLILEIFERRASSAESRIQVKLAQLRYEMTRAREKVRLARQGEQPGFFGLGRYEVDNYYRDIKRRIATLKSKLGKVSTRRTLHRIHRNKQGLPTACLAGYTSVGKTTLFNLLAGEEKDSGRGMFTTLSTSTRGIDLSDGRLLLSDTVGFISKLPAYMIEAFRSTLEELTWANVVLLVIDVSEPMNEMMRKFDSSLKALNELDVAPSKILYVLNKLDLTTQEDAIEKAKKLGIWEPDKTVLMSSKTGYNVETLLEMIEKKVFSSKAKADGEIEADNAQSVPSVQQDQIPNLIDIHGDES